MHQHAELPGAQHAFDVFHSIRSTHVVRAVDRYLNWHWNTWRHGLPADADALKDVGDAEFDLFHDGRLVASVPAIRPGGPWEWDDVVARAVHAAQPGIELLGVV